MKYSQSEGSWWLPVFNTLAWYLKLLRPNKWFDPPQLNMKHGMLGCVIFAGVVLLTLAAAAACSIVCILLWLFAVEQCLGTCHYVLSFPTWFSITVSFLSCPRVQGWFTPLLEYAERRWMFSLALSIFRTVPSPPEGIFMPFWLMLIWNVSYRRWWATYTWLYYCS